MEIARFQYNTLFQNIDLEDIMQALNRPPKKLKMIYNCYCCEGFRFPIESHTSAKLWVSAMLVQSQKAKIFQVGKRNIQNQKIIDKWSNAEIALLRPF